MTSPSPPCPATLTLGIPDTAARLPLVASTSHSRPSFSVSSAMLVRGTPLPGRKAIAHGVLNSAIGVTLNDRSLLISSCAAPRDWQAVTSAAIATACKIVRAIRCLLNKRGEPKDLYEPGQPSVPRHRASAAYRRAILCQNQG